MNTSHGSLFSRDASLDRSRIARKPSTRSRRFIGSKHHHTHIIKRVAAKKPAAKKPAAKKPTAKKPAAKKPAAKKPAAKKPAKK